MAVFALDREARSFAQINVTPLVDVMLVLLIIFMLAAPMLTHKLTLNFSEKNCSATTCPKPTDPVDLSIKQTGELTGMASHSIAVSLRRISRCSDSRTNHLL